MNTAINQKLLLKNYLLNTLISFCVLFQEYVLQEDGTVTPVQLLNVQNLVLDEQRAGQILTLAQVCCIYI